VTDLGSEADVWPGVSRWNWTPTSDPPSSLHSGGYTGIALRNINLPASDNAAVFDLDLLEEPQGELIVYPNPYRPRSDDRLSILYRPAGAPTGRADDDLRFEIQIFDMTGTPVRALHAEEDPPSDWTSSWDGRNDAGDDVASGIYLLVLHGGDDTVTGKIAIVR